MKQQIIITLAFTLAFTSCQKKATIDQNNEAEITHIDFTDAKEADDVSIFYDYIEDVKLIKLEANDNSFIKYISSVIITDDRIFVFDPSNRSNQIMVFDKDGKWITTSKHGNGPGEIVQAYGMTYDKQKDRLVVIQAYWLTYFDKDLHYIKDYEPKYEYQCIVFNNDEILLKTRGDEPNEFLNENAGYSFIVTDTAFNLKYTALPIYRLMTSLSQPLKVLNNAVDIIAGECDTVYRYADNKVSPKYVFEYNDKASTESLIKAKDIDEFGDYVKQLDGYSLVNMHETNDMLFAEFWNGHRDKTLYGLYNKKSKNSVSCILDNDYLRKNFHVFTNFILPYTYNDYFISPTWSDFLQQQKKELMPFLSEEDKAILRDMTEDDNPMIVLFKYKDF